MSTSQQHRLKAARWAAAVGRYSLASAFLDAITDPALGSETQVLRGHIHAQQGRYAEALGLWEQALARSPGDARLEKAIRRLRAMQETGFTPPSTRFRLAALCGLALCSLLLLAAAFALGRWTTRAGAAKPPGLTLAAADTLEPPTQALLQQQTLAISGQVDLVQNRLAEGHAALRAGLDALAAELPKARAVADLAVAVQNVQGEIRTLDRRMNDATAGLSNALQSIRLQQEQQLRDDTARGQAIQAARGDLARLRDAMAAETARSDQRLHAMIDLLRPVNLDRLAREIQDAEAAISVLRTEAARPPSDGPHGLISRRAALRSELREIENRLASLREAWEQHVVPWLKARAALSGSGEPAARPDKALH
ncbi:MAG TPA: hypothetical protein PKM73_03760 [Verrucomicrobiota bacterium]|nr:hypothetical protein [Verrucomicrobiota bacterium]HNU50823.1 hypothetical protein [Verrucomicrobiota bacterium]